MNYAQIVDKLIAERDELRAELERLRAQGPCAWRHDCAGLCTNDVELWIDACPHCGKPRAAPPAQSEDESLEFVMLQQLCDRMADLLTRTAAALKGPPEPLTLHDWADLPDVAADVAAVARLKPYSDPPLPAQPAEPVQPQWLPIEPTPGMVTAGAIALVKASDSDLDPTREEIIATYRAMIAAAPKD